MEKQYMLNYLNGQISVLESLKKSMTDESFLTVIQAKLDTLNDLIEVVNKAPIPYELI